MNVDELIFIIIAYVSHLSSRFSFLRDESLDVEQKTKYASSLIVIDDNTPPEIQSHIYLWTNFGDPDDWTLTSRGVDNDAIYDKIVEFDNNQNELTNTLLSIIENHENGKYDSFIDRIRMFPGHNQDYIILSAALKYINLQSDEYITQQFTDENSEYMQLLSNADVLSEEYEDEEVITSKLIVLSDMVGIDVEYLYGFLGVDKEDIWNQVKRSLNTKDRKWLLASKGIEDEDYHQIADQLDYDDLISPDVLSKYSPIDDQLTKNGNKFALSLLYYLKTHNNNLVDTVYELIINNVVVINKLAECVQDVNNKNVDNIIYIISELNEYIKGCDFYSTKVVYNLVVGRRHKILDLVLKEEPEHINKITNNIAKIFPENVTDTITELCKQKLIGGNIQWDVLTDNVILMMVVLLKKESLGYYSNNKFFTLYPKTFDKIMRLLSKITGIQDIGLLSKFFTSESRLIELEHIHALKNTRDLSRDVFVLFLKRAVKSKDYKWFTSICTFINNKKDDYNFIVNTLSKEFSVKNIAIIINTLVKQPLSTRIKFLRAFRSNPEESTVLLYSQLDDLSTAINKVADLSN